MKKSSKKRMTLNQKKAAGMERPSGNSKYGQKLALRKKGRRLSRSPIQDAEVIEAREREKALAQVIEGYKEMAAPYRDIRLVKEEEGK